MAEYFAKRYYLQNDDEKLNFIGKWYHWVTHHVYYDCEKHQKLIDDYEEKW